MWTPCCPIRSSLTYSTNRQKILAWPVTLSLLQTPLCVVCSSVGWGAVVQGPWLGPWARPLTWIFLRNVWPWFLKRRKVCCFRLMYRLNKLNVTPPPHLVKAQIMQCTSRAAEEEQRRKQGYKITTLFSVMQGNAKYGSADRPLEQQVMGPHGREIAEHPQRSDGNLLPLCSDNVTNDLKQQPHCSRNMLSILY